MKKNVKTVFDSLHLPVDIGVKTESKDFDDIGKTNDIVDI